jgi:hypothetical protein
MTYITVMRHAHVGFFNIKGSVCRPGKLPCFVQIGFFHDEKQPFKATFCTAREKGARGNRSRQMKRDSGLHRTSNLIITIMPILSA